MPKKSGSKQKVYAVAVGREPGIYHTWNECEAQVKGFSKAKFKSFPILQDAQAYMEVNSLVHSHNGSGSSSNQNNNHNGGSSSNQNNNIGNADGNKKRSNQSLSNAASMEQHSESRHKKQRKSADNAARALPQDNEEETNTNEPLRLPRDSKIEKIDFHINFDGGSRGNPKGAAGSGAHIVTRIHYHVKQESSSSAAAALLSARDSVLRRKADIYKYLGKGRMTNNQAEYLGVIAGLEHVLETLQEVQSYFLGQGTSVTILVQGDSKLVIQQLLGNWQCKNENMKALCKRSQDIVKDIEEIMLRSSSSLDIHFEHVYRQDNTVADRLANAAMDAERSWTTITNEEEGESNGKKVGKIILV